MRNANDPYLNVIIPKTGYVPTVKTWYQNRGLYKAVGSSFDPEPGDLVLFNWAGSGPLCDHIGIVVSVDTANKRVTYVDGNNTAMSPHGVNQMTRYYGNSSAGVDGFADVQYIGPDRYESNNTRSAATSLVSQTSGTLSNLTIHNSSDVDYFKINLGNTGTSSNYVLADFSDAAGDLDMRLYNSSGSVVRSSESSTDDERISLSGLGAGTYYVEIDGYGSDTNTYSLQWNTGLSPDSHESNNTRSTATSLVGQTSGTRSNLTIHNSSDVDYFKISLGSTGTSENFVLADFSDAAGDLDMRLYNSSGSLVRSSTSVTDDERISLSGLGAGTYYVEIDGYGSATNTYSLEWNTVRYIGPDRYESNDTRATATSLVNQSSGTLSNLTIDDPSHGEQDYFKIRLNGSGQDGDYIRVNFDRAVLGELRLENSAGSTVRRSLFTDSDGEISLAGVAPGTYYINVASAQECGYSLQWKTDAPVSPDSYESNNTRSTATYLYHSKFTIDDLTIHNSSDVDYFEIYLGSTGTSNNYILADFSDAAGDLDMYLYNSSGSLVRSSTSVTDDERISLSGLGAGTYYIKVDGIGSDTNNYSLQYDVFPSPDRYESNNTRSTATSLVGQNSGTLNNLTIHSSSDVDYFKINLGRTGTSDNYVLADSDSAFVKSYVYNSSGSLLRSSETSTNDDGRISLSGLGAGTYYVKVDRNWMYTNSNTYSLQWNTEGGLSPDSYESNNSRGTATSLVGQTSGTLSNLTIHNSSDVDYFKINLGATGTLLDYVRVNFTHSAGDLDMRLYNSSGTVVRSSTSSTDDERISLSGLSAGTYYVEIDGYGSATNTYSLQWRTPDSGPDPDVPSPDRYESNNSRSTATSLVGQTSGTLSNLTIHNTSDEDYFKINLGSTGTSSHYVLADFSDAAGDLDLYLYDRSGNSIRSSASVTNDERISLANLSAGTYYVEIDGYGSATNTYSLQWHTPDSGSDPDVPSPDRYESNNSRSTATSVLVGFGNATLNNLSIHNSTDEDYFTITLGITNRPDYVLADFSHAAGDLDMFLYDRSGTLVRSSTSASDDERISLSGRTQVRTTSKSMDIAAQPTPIRCNWGQLILLPLFRAFP